MGLSNLLQKDTETGSAPTGGTGTAAQAPKTFGDKLGDYFKNRYPIAGGLAGMVFDPQQQGQPATAPLTSMPGNTQPDYSQMIAQTAQPQQSGNGLEAIIKLLGL